MAVNLDSLRLTGNRDNTFSRGFWNTFLTKLSTLLTNQVKPYKVYTALLTQTGENAPVVTVLENTLGDISFGYSSAGNYTITSDKLFIDDKTVVTIGQNNNNGGGGNNTFVLYSTNISSSSLLQFSSLDVSDTGGSFTDNGLLTKTQIEIRVYN